MATVETAELAQENNRSEVSSEDDEVQKLERLKVLELATLCTLPMALRAAIMLDVFEIMNKVSPTCHISAQGIAAHIPATNANAAVTLDRILKLLASRDILSAVVVEVDGKYESRYGLTSLVRNHLINNEKGRSVASLVVFDQDEVMMAPYQYLPQAVLEGGECFLKAHGKNVFQLTRGDLRFGELFNTAMGSHSILVMKAVLDCYDGFKNIRKLVDVGGGIGYCLEMIISRYPHIQGINFDLPDVIAHAHQSPGVEHVAGDMFQGVPPGEAIFMKVMLRGWNDENCVKILQNCYKSLPPSGKVIVVDAILPPSVDGSLCSQVNYSIDMLLLANSPGGKERTEKEFKDLAVASGFAGMKVVCRADPMSVIEIYKAV